MLIKLLRARVGEKTLIVIGVTVWFLQIAGFGTFIYLMYKVGIHVGAW